MGRVDISFDENGNLVFALKEKTDVETVNKACWGEEEKYEWDNPAEKDGWRANNASFEAQYPTKANKVIPPLLKNENPSKGIIIRDEAPEITSSPPIDKVCPCKLLPNEPCTPG